MIIPLTALGQGLITLLGSCFDTNNVIQESF